MTDYPYNFGDCCLMIRDNGSGANPNVEFWFYAFNQGVDWGLLQFEKRVNNNTFVFSANIHAHAGWVQVSVDSAGLSQFVTWQLDTNLGYALHGGPDPGFPYSTTQYLTRPTVPDPPSTPYIFNVAVDSVNVGWDPPENNGGATILGYQVGYGQNVAGPTTIIDASSGVAISNLPMGAVSYFWVRARNYQGYSNWSGLNSARTYLGAYVKTGGVWKLAIPYVNVGGVWQRAEPKVFHS